MVDFVEPTQERLQWIAEHMRREDRIEIGFSHPGATAYEVLDLSVRISEFARVAMDPKTQEPFAVYGSTHGTNLLHGIGMGWILGTGRAGTMRFARTSRRMLPSLFLPGIDVLTNAVWIEYADCLRWLTWLGAHFAETPVPDHPQLIQFWWVRDEIVGAQ